MGEVGYQLAFGREQHTDAIGQHVEGLPDRSNLLRAIGHDALRQVALTEPGRGGGQRAHGPHHRRAQSI